jgi:hypothetical protein
MVWKQGWAFIWFMEMLAMTFVIVKSQPANDSDSSQDIFFNHMSDDEFLQEIEKAERELKIYIYPTVRDATTVEFHNSRDSTLMPHFKAE